MQILALFVGRSKRIAARSSNEWWDQPWESGIFKEAASGPVWLAYGGLQGDEQADRKNHGGPEKAVCAYPAAHYDYWRRRPGLADIPFGGFGENLTLGGATETQLCIGDRFKFDDAIVEISQPRQPCWKLSRRWHVKDLKEQAEQTGFTGFYFRVVKHGWLRLGGVGVLLERPCPEWNLAGCNEIMHKRLQDFAAAQRLAQCPQLSGSWKDTLFARARSLDKKWAGSEIAKT
ncbi:MAG: MOSC domain-containing protein [Verrucomicrobia bacterium]|nr:MOSC domain-containing protein [Verrucomicrobiota bacterium]MDE3100438.1 MOSC domain-containing protein [Verrucomicrobiota bacterium]